MRIKSCISIFPVALGLLIASGASALEITNGLITNGLITNGLITNGLITNGLSTNGLSTNGLSTNGLSTNGLSTNGQDNTGTVSSVARLEAVILQDETVLTLAR